jgi:putative ABC transport system permease protein
MWYFEIDYKNVQRRKTRTVLTAAGLAVAVTAITAIWNIAWGYARYATSYYAVRNVDVVVVRAGISDRLTSSLQSELAQRLRSLPGIKSVDGGLTEMVSLGETKLIGIPLRGFEPDGFTVAALTIIEGRNLRSSDQGGILLGNGIAALLGKHAGQQLEIEGTPFEVLGALQSANPYEMNSVVARLSDVQSLMDRPDIVSEFQICAAESIRANSIIPDRGVGGIDDTAVLRSTIDLSTPISPGCELSLFSRRHTTEGARKRPEAYEVKPYFFRFERALA